MGTSEDYCELCDLPTSQCVHGRRPPPVAPATTARARSAKPSTTPKPRKRAAASAGPVTRSAPRKWTRPEEFRPAILELLAEAGGEMENEQFFVELETRVGDLLRPGDRERTPEGELRWRYAARRARQAMIGEGLMTKGGPGVWKLGR
ncbi:MAG: hypothetical protein QM638_17955 [Nocardioides sp.]|uniref:hypothetical protein n=1 Tax=Nocardioides sp. TaxID=35761 RepID=UPI0039E6C9CC